MSGQNSPHAPQCSRSRRVAAIGQGHSEHTLLVFTQRPSQQDSLLLAH